MREGDDVDIEDADFSGPDAGAHYAGAHYNCMGDARDLAGHICAKPPPPPPVCVGCGGG